MVWTNQMHQIKIRFAYRPIGWECLVCICGFHINTENVDIVNKDFVT